MTCPMCGAATRVINTCSELDVVYRQRECKSCGHKFVTEENESNAKLPNRRSKRWKQINKH